MCSILITVVVARMDAGVQPTRVRLAYLLVLASGDAERPQSVLEGWACIHGVLQKEVSKPCPAPVSVSYVLSSLNSLDFCGDILWDSHVYT